MKILHVIPALEKGGAQRVVIDLSNAAVERGHSVTILTALPINQFADHLRSEIEVRCIAPSADWRLRAYLLLVPWILSNRKWLLSRDIVHCHLTYASVFAAVLQKFRGRRPTPAIVETYHAVGMAIPKRKRAVHAALLKRRDAAAFMARDPFWQRYATTHLGGRFSLIPNGVASPAHVGPPLADIFRRERTKVPAERDAVIGSVGRLDAERRPDLLVETFVRLFKGTGREIHLLLAGEGAASASLKAQVRSHGLDDRVHMPGLILNPGEPFALIDLYLTVNVGPTTGIAALEAALAGLPIIALQLQDGYEASSNDWIWSSPSPADVALRAAELLGNPSRMKALAHEQQAYARAHHGVDAMAKAYHEFYEEALVTRRAGAHPCLHRSVDADHQR